jgi:hypothetical protein
MTGGANQANSTVTRSPPGRFTTISSAPVVGLFPHRAGPSNGFGRDYFPGAIVALSRPHSGHRSGVARRS